MRFYRCLLSIRRINQLPWFSLMAVLLASMLLGSWRNGTWALSLVQCAVFACASAMLVKLCIGISEALGSSTFIGLVAMLIGLNVLDALSTLLLAPRSNLSEMAKYEINPVFSAMFDMDPGIYASIALFFFLKTWYGLAMAAEFGAFLILDRKGRRRRAKEYSEVSYYTIFSMIPYSRTLKYCGEFMTGGIRYEKHRRPCNGGFQEWYCFAIRTVIPTVAVSIMLILASLSNLAIVILRDTHVGGVNMARAANAALLALIALLIIPIIFSKRLTRRLYAALRDVSAKIA